MPVTPGTFDPRTRTGEIILTEVTARVFSRAQADRLAASYGEVIDWAGSTWPLDLSGGGEGLHAFARLGEAARAFEDAVRACRALGDDIGQDAVTRLIESVGRSIGDY
jgi:hypothetical protein